MECGIDFHLELWAGFSSGATHFFVFCCLISSFPRLIGRHTRGGEILPTFFLLLLLFLLFSHYASNCGGLLHFNWFCTSHCYYLSDVRHLPQVANANLLSMPLVLPSLPLDSVMRSDWGLSLFSPISQGTYLVQCALEHWAADVGQERTSIAFTHGNLHAASKSILIE